MDWRNQHMCFAAVCAFHLALACTLLLILIMGTQHVPDNILPQHPAIPHARHHYAAAELSCKHCTAVCSDPPHSCFISPSLLPSLLCCPSSSDLAHLHFSRLLSGPLLMYAHLPPPVRVAPNRHKVLGHYSLTHFLLPVCWCHTLPLLCCRPPQVPGLAVR